jgi:hypothetical protein
LYRESKDKADIFEAEFKQRVFIASPDIYQEMFGSQEQEYLDPEEIQNVVPQSEEEFAAMMRELQKSGLALPD